LILIVIPIEYINIDVYNNDPQVQSSKRKFEFGPKFEIEFIFI